jgi:hypothetical protein
MRPCLWLLFRIKLPYASDNVVADVGCILHQPRERRFVVYSDDARYVIIRNFTTLRFHRTSSIRTPVRNSNTVNHQHNGGAVTGKMWVRRTVSF